MPRLAWSQDDLTALDAEGLQRKWDEQITALRDELTPKPAPPPAPSFDLADWSPWRQNTTKPDTSGQNTTKPDTSSLFDDPGWFPWRTPKAAGGTPSAMPTAPQAPDLTVSTGTRVTGAPMQPGEGVGSMTVVDGRTRPEIGPAVP